MHRIEELTTHAKVLEKEKIALLDSHRELERGIEHLLDKKEQLEAQLIDVQLISKLAMEKEREANEMKVQTQKLIEERDKLNAEAEE